MNFWTGPDVTAPDLPTIADVEAAARRLAGHVVRTPLLESDLLNKALDCRLLVKAEVLQRTGAFKFRGAFNALSMLSAGQLAKGVVAYSSGNHAQAVACAARLLGAPAVIVMPEDAPAIKLAGTRAHGAEVITFNRQTENREAIGERLADERGLSLIKPYDAPAVIAGQGTAGLEIVEQCKALGITPDLAATPAGGGGLMAGTALALSHTWPDLPLYTAEPAGWEDHALSLAADARQPAPDTTTPTLCDALLAPIPGELTFAINRERVTGGIVIDDTMALSAMATAFRHFKIVIEPGGAAALAAVLSGQLDVAGKTIVVIASGGNVDPSIYRRALAEGTVHG